MVELSFFKLLFAAFPENLLLIYVGLGLVGIKTKFINYLKISAASIFTLWIVRNVFHFYGLHIIIMVLIAALMIKLVLNIDLKYGVTASLLAFILLGVGEVVTFYIIENFLNIQVAKFLKLTNMKYYLFTYAMKVHLIVIAGLIYKYDFKLINLGGGENEFGAG